MCCNVHPPARVSTSGVTPDIGTGSAAVSHATLAAVDLRKVTEREREVFGLLGSHLTHEQIGQRLFISVRTVESHVASLRRKLAIPDHRTLVKVAAEHGSAAGTRGAATRRGFRPCAPR